MDHDDGDDDEEQEDGDDDDDDRDVLLNIIFLLQSQWSVLSSQPRYSAPLLFRPFVGPVFLFQTVAIFLVSFRI